MGLPMAKERRLNKRKQLSGLLPGRLQVFETRRELTCKPIDVSEFGLGVIIAGEFPVGTELVLVTKDSEIKLTIQWGQLDFAKQDLYRYGLVTESSDIDLEELFIKAGCLK